MLRPVLAVILFSLAAQACSGEVVGAGSDVLGASSASRIEGGFLVASVTPSAARAGAELTVAGDGLTPEARVTIAGQPAEVVSREGTKALKLRVPEGAPGVQTIAVVKGNETVSATFLRLGAPGETLLIGEAADACRGTTYFDAEGKQFDGTRDCSPEPRPGSLTTQHFVPGSLAGSVLADGTITARAIATATITSDQLADAAVSARNLAPGSVTSGHLAAGAVTTAQLATGAVTTAQLATAAVQSAQLAPGAVTAEILAAGAVGPTRLAAGAVTADHIAAGAVGTPQLAPGAVGPTQLAPGAVGPLQLAAGAITSDHLAANAVTGAKVAAGSLTSAHFAPGALTGADLAPQSITAQQLAAGSVGSIQLAANAVQGSHLANAAVSSAQIAANGIRAANIDDAAIITRHIAAGAVGSAQLATGAVHDAQVAPASLTGASLADASIGAAKLAPGAVGLVALADMGCTVGQTLKWNAGQWTCAPDLAGGLPGSIGSGDLAVGSVIGGAGGAILDGSITDADLAPGAGITDDKLATIATAGKVSGNAVTSGTIGGAVTLDSTGEARVQRFLAKPRGTGAGQTGELLFRELTANGSDAVGFKAPDALATSFTWTLPAADGTNGMFLATNGAGQLAWSFASATPTGAAGGDLAGTYPNPTVGVGRITGAHIQDGAIMDADIGAAAQIADTKLATIATAGKISGDALTLGTIGGTAGFAGTGGVNLRGTGTNVSELSFSDTTNANSVGFRAPASLAATTKWTLPIADGSAGQLLRTDGAGNLSWVPDQTSPTGVAGGDLAGTYPSPTLSATGVAAGDYAKVTVDAKGRVQAGQTKISLADIAASSCANGQFVRLNASGNWVCADMNGEANTASNAGAGGAGTADLFKTKTGVDLVFRRLAGGNGISLTQDTDQVVIAAINVEDTIAAGERTKAPSQRAVSDGLALKQNSLQATDAVSIGSLTLNTSQGLLLRGSAGQTGKLSFNNAANDRSISFAAPTGLTTSHAFILPGNTPATGDVLQFAGSGQLAWATPPPETDPQVATLVEGKWCKSVSGAVNCTENAPITTELDPKVGTMTPGGWCTSNGTKVTCTAQAPVMSDAQGKVDAGLPTQDYEPTAMDLNSTMTLYALDTASLGFYDAGHSLGSITYSSGLFTLGHDAGWGPADVYLPGKVGVAMTTPPAQLAVRGASTLVGSLQIASCATPGQASFSGSPDLSKVSPGDVFVDDAGTRFLVAAVNDATDLVTWTPATNCTSNAALARITRNGLVVDDGNVGIGTRVPNHKLDVSGTVNATTMRITCPAGFTSIEHTTSGRQLGCIQTDLSTGGSIGCLQAADSCWDAYGGRLPTYAESLIARLNFTLANANDDEWVDMCALLQSDSTPGAAVPTIGHAYRCWIDR